MQVLERDIYLALMNNTGDYGVARKFPQTHNINNVFTFGISEYKPESNALYVEVECNNTTPESTDSMAEQAKFWMNNAGYNLCGVEDSSDGQRGAWKKKLTFVTLVMDCAHKIRLSIYGGGSFNAVAGLSSLNEVPGERAVIQTVGSGGVSTAVFKTVKSYGKVIVAGRRIYNDDGQIHTEANYIADSIVAIRLSAGGKIKEAKAAVTKHMSGAGGFEAEFSFLGGWVNVS